MSSNKRHLLHLFHRLSLAEEYRLVDHHYIHRIHQRNTTQLVVDTALRLSSTYNQYHSNRAYPKPRD